MIHRWAVSSLLVAALALMIPVAGRSAPTAFCATSPVVTPGVGIGDVRLGVPVEQDIQVLGAPSDMRRVDDTGAWWTVRQHTRLTQDAQASGWLVVDYRSGPNGGIGLLSRDGVVVKIELSGLNASLAGCATVDGVHIGGPVDELKNWGQPTMVFHTLLVYNDLGVFATPYHTSRPGFPDPVIIQLGVFLPGQWCQVTALNPKSFTPPCP